MLAEADAAEETDWLVSVDSTISRTHQHRSNTIRPDQPTGARANNKNLGDPEPEYHAVGRPRGGFSSKLHPAVDN